MKIKKIYISILLSVGMLFSVTVGIAQDTTAVVESSDSKPVRSPWTTSILIDNQTTEGPNAKAYEVTIYHRFGVINKMDDILGIYAPSNIRLGVNYGITDAISIGFGTEKNKKYQEFQGKYQILKQTRDGKMPVSVTYFGNVAIDARDKEVFGADYEFVNRLSFFNQAIVSRKFNKDLSVMAAVSYSHFNAVTDLVQDSLGNTIGKWKNDYIGAMLGARYKIINNMSAICEYHQSFGLKKAWQGQDNPLPNLAIGVEFGTSTHAFQVFASNYNGILAQENYAHNESDMADQGWRFGFNITVRF